MLQASKKGEKRENFFKKKYKDFMYFLVALESFVLFWFTLIPCALSISLYINIICMMDLCHKIVILGRNSNPDSSLYQGLFMYIVAFVFVFKKIKTKKNRKNFKKEIKIVSELKMTSVLLWHALQCATLWDNTAIGKACFPRREVKNVVYVS